MADKRISQLIERTDIANNDVLPIVASGATTTNKVTISTIQDWMQDNLDVGVTSVGITLGTSGTDVNVSGSPITTSGNITINIPDASASARGVVTTGSQTFAGVKTFSNGLSLPAVGGSNQVTRIVNIGTLHEGTASLNQIGFNSGNNIYFGKGLSNGGVLQWNNSAVRYYTFPDADGTLALASDLTGYVTLGTAQTITAQKTFTTSGSSDTMIISHGSGSGIALDVIKAGNGEAIRVQKTSGSGNAVTITGGTLSAEAGQFSGDLQSATRVIAAASSQSIILTPNSGGTTNRVESVGTLPLALVSAAAITIAAGGTTPQITLATGGGVTLTGALNGTSASFTGQVQINNGQFFNAKRADGAGINVLGFPSGSNNLTSVTPNDYNLQNTGGANLFSVSSAGAATFSSSVTATELYLSTSSGLVGNINSSATNGGYLTWQTAGTTIADIGTANQIFGSGGSEVFGINARGARSLSFGTNNTARLTIASTGAATFSSSVTAGGALRVSGGSTFTNGELEFTSTTSGGQLGIFSNQGTSTTLFFDHRATGNTGNFSFRNGSGGANTLMYIAGSGNVGIGTASPIDKLNVNAGGITFTGSLPSPSNTSVGSLQIGYDGTQGVIQTWMSSPLLISTYNYQAFSTNGTERMRITSGGYLKATSDGTYVASGSNFHEMTATANGTDLLLIRHKGTDPYGFEMQFSGATPNNGTNWFQYFQDATAARFIVRSNGGLQNYQANDGNLSDERTKKDIEPLESYWDKFKAIEIVKFKYKDQTHDDFNIGVIAQQVEAVAPEFVDVDGWGKPELDEEGNEIVSEEEPLKSIYTADLYHATIKVLQEAMAKIEKLEAEIDSLKTK